MTLKTTKRIVMIVIALLIAALFAGCGGGGTSQEQAPAPEPAPAPATESAPTTDTAAAPALQGEILIAVAASLQNAFEGDLIPLFNKEYPDVKITGTYDSSGKLQTQIEEGFDASLFFSAATKQMDALVGEGLIDSTTVVNLLENEVVLITGTDTKTSVTGFENISGAASVAIGDPASVPAGQYAQEVLTSLGSWDGISSRASLGSNVTEVLNWVAEGSAEVGVVYMTDAASMPDKVRVIASAPAGSLKAPVVYPVGLKANLGDNADIATAFLDFLKSPEAADIFTSYGFKVIV